MEEYFTQDLVGALDYANMTTEDLQKSWGCQQGHGGIVIKFGRNVEYEIVRTSQTLQANLIMNNQKFSH